MLTLSSTQFVAHRGAHKQHPENSLVSIREALKHLSHVEIDVHPLGDNLVVVKHDAPVTGDTLPTLQEALALVKQDPESTLFVELKPDLKVGADKFVQSVIMSIDLMQIPSSQIILISFSLDYLKAAKHQKPNIRCGFLTASDPAEPDNITIVNSNESFKKMLNTLSEHHIDGIGLETLCLKREWIITAHQRGFFTHVWLRSNQENETTALEVADKFNPTYCNTDFAESFIRA